MKKQIIFLLESITSC